jgi:hypothetical protein
MGEQEMNEKNEKGTTAIEDGITACCGYDFGTDGFGNIKVKFCPICGKKIVKIK